MLYGAVAASDLRFVPVASARFAGAGNLSVSGSLYNPLIQGSANFAGAGQMSINMDAPQTYAFLARTTGLDATHINAYRSLINGLVDDGIWSKFDALWIFATQDETTALLNLCSSSYPMAKTLSPTFTQDQGYSGNATNYLSEGTNLSALTQFQQNSAHIMVWDLTSGGTLERAIGNADGTSWTHIHPRYSDTKAYFRINSATGATGCNATVASTKGCSIANRSSATAVQGYKNGSSVASNSSDSSVAPSATLLYVPESGVAETDLIAAASIGSSLSSGDVTKLYNRVYTHLQAVGVSSPT